MSHQRRRRIVQPSLAESAVEDLIACLAASDLPSKADSIARLRDALTDAQRPRVLVPPKRLVVFHEFCELSPDAQAVVADVVSWLKRHRASTHAEVLESLGSLAADSADARPL